MRHPGAFPAEAYRYDFISGARKDLALDHERLDVQVVYTDDPDCVLALAKAQMAGATVIRREFSLSRIVYGEISEEHYVSRSPQSPYLALRELSSAVAERQAYYIDNVETAQVRLRERQKAHLLAIEDVDHAQTIADLGCKPCGDCFMELFELRKLSLHLACLAETEHRAGRYNARPARLKGLATRYRRSGMMAGDFFGRLILRASPVRTPLSS